MLLTSSLQFADKIYLPYSEPEQRPTASQLRRHIFLELPPDWDFLDSSLNQ